MIVLQSALVDSCFQHSPCLSVGNLVHSFVKICVNLVWTNPVWCHVVSFLCLSPAVLQQNNCACSEFLVQKEKDYDLYTTKDIPWVRVL